MAVNLQKSDSIITADGMDYGILPKIMIASDPSLSELWGAAGFTALGYAQIPESQGGTPLMMVLFQDIRMGLAFFELVKQWGNIDDEGGGIDIAIIEDPKKVRYFFLIGINHERMIDRAMPKTIQEHFSPLVLTANFGKEFSISQYLPAFKQYAENKPIFVVPADINDQKPRWEYGFIKKNINFSRLSQLREESWEFRFLQVIDKPKRKNQSKWKANKKDEAHFADPEEVNSFRQKRLKRLFPITLARLEHNASYKASARNLANFHSWQVTQAACNLICSWKFPDTVDNGITNFLKVYDLLIKTPESPTDASAIEFNFDPQMIELQINRDMCRLCDDIFLTSGIERPPDYVSALRKGGYI